MEPKTKIRSGLSALCQGLGFPALAGVAFASGNAGYAASAQVSCTLTPAKAGTPNPCPHSAFK